MFAFESMIYKPNSFEAKFITNKIQATGTSLYHEHLALVRYYCILQMPVITFSLFKFCGYLAVFDLP